MIDRGTFLQKLQDELEIESPLTFDTELKQLDEWSSFTTLMLIGFAERSFSVLLTIQDIEEMTSIESLVQRLEKGS